MKEYMKLGRRYVPYIMEMPGTNIRNKYYSTDEYGFRRTIKDNKYISLKKFNNENYKGKRCAFLGNSTGYGVGSTSDLYTIPNRLNSMGDSTWFNFSGRAFQSTQEILTFFFFCERDINQCLIFSGINNFDMCYKWANDYQIKIPPFYSQNVFKNTFRDDLLINNKFHMYLDKIHNKILSKSTTYRNYLTDNQIKLYFNEILSQDESNEIPKCIDRSIKSFGRDLRKLCFIIDPSKIKFILQPILEWSHKSLSEEEKYLIDINKIRAGEKWIQVMKILEKFIDYYINELSNVCKSHQIEFFNFNNNSEFKSNEWLFIDRYHLTDRGYKISADYIKSILEL